MAAVTLRQLEIFAQAVEHGSFRRCAEHIGVSQVAISDHVRSLEAGLGRRLFERPAGGPARLTAEGEMAYRRVVDILSDVTDLLWELDPDRRSSGRHLAVAAQPFLMDRLQGAAAEFGRLHPELYLQIDLEPATPAVLQERVRNRALDLAYFFSFDGREAPDSEVVSHEPVAAFVACDHPLAAREVVTTAELRAVPAIQLTANSLLRGPIDRLFEQAGLAGGPIGLETDDYGLILSSVRRGLGFVCMFRGPDDEVLQTDGLRRLELDPVLPALQVRQISRRSSRRDPLVHALEERLCAALRP